MNENNRPKSPGEILAALSTEGNRIEQLTKEIDEKIYAFYGIQKQFIENGNLITTEQKKVLDDLKNYKLPEISLDASAKKQFEEVKLYEKNVRKKDKILLYVVLLFIVQAGIGLYYFNYGVKTKREFKKEFEDNLLKDGKVITDKENYENLDFNTRMIYEWIEENKEDSESFKSFLRKKEQEKKEVNSKNK